MLLSGCGIYLVLKWAHERQARACDDECAVDATPEIVSIFLEKIQSYALSVTGERIISLLLCGSCVEGSVRSWEIRLRFDPARTIDQKFRL